MRWTRPLPPSTWTASRGRWCCNRHELPILYDLVEQFVRQVGPGVMKKLILDRGFIDGARIAYCKTVLGVDVLIPLKKNMDLWQDAWRLAE